MVVARPTLKNKKTTCKPKTCPTCGGLECFERPRYFGGQLLTDKDLDAAQRYVIEKNRLHNRYLVGTGVVCGLAVQCHPSCNGVVIVNSGYAIDCCGNDLVVCESTEFDVIQYLKDCFKPQSPTCSDMIRTRNTQCGDAGPKEYYLVMSYSETLTSPISALIRDNGCTNSRCEPSRTSETFRLDLVEKQDSSQQPSAQNFWNKYQKCIESKTQLSKLDSNNLQSFYQLKAFIWEFYQQELDTRCNLAEELHAIETEMQASETASTHTDNATTNAVGNAIAQLQTLFLQLFWDCFCNALLVPCADCDPEQGVVLACLTIQNGKILKICNNARQQLITGPMLSYFLPPQNLGGATGGTTNKGQELWLTAIYTVFGNLFERRCCETSSRQVQLGATTRTAEFSNTGTPLTRTAAVFNLVRDFANSPSAVFNAFQLNQVADTNTLTALDLYDRPVEQLRSLFQSHNITNIVENTASTAAAIFTPENLATMAWTIPQGSQVELVINPVTNRVALIRLLQGGGQ